MTALSKSIEELNTNGTNGQQILREAREQGRVNPYDRNSRYYEMFENNPYTIDKFRGKETDWDYMMNLLGFTSGYETQVQDWLKARDEYDAQIAQLKGEDEYNSDKEKAQRMAEAGLNADLLGTQGASEAGEFAQEQTSPVVTERNQGVNEAFQILNTIPKAITFAMSMTQEVSKTMGLLYDNRTKRIDNGKKMIDLAKSFIENFSDDEAGQKDEKFNYYDVAIKVAQQAEVWARQNGMSRQQAKKFSDQVETTMLGSKGDIYEKWKKKNTSRTEYGIQLGNKYIPKSDEEEEILEVVGELAQNESDIIINSSRARKEKSQNEYDYEKEFNGTQKATAENEENAMKAGKSKIVQEARKALNIAMQKLDKACKNGNILAIALNSALASLQLKFVE